VSGFSRTNRVQLAPGFTSESTQAGHRAAGHYDAFSTEHALDNGGGQRVGVAFELLAGGIGLGSKSHRGFPHRSLHLAPCRSDKLGAGGQRRTPVLLHLTVHVAARRRVFASSSSMAACARRARCFASSRADPIALSLAFIMARHGPEQEPIERDRQHQHEADDPHNR